MWAVWCSQQIGEKLEERTFPGGTWKDLWSSDRTNGSTEPWIKEQSEPTLLMLLHTAEINTLLNDTSEYGHGSTLKHKDFSNCYLCRATFTLLFPTPLTFQIPLHWRSLNTSTCPSALWAVICSLSVLGAGAQGSELCCRGSEGCAQPLSLFCLRNWKILIVPFSIWEF